jgi:hypothetical protein
MNATTATPPLSCQRLALPSTLVTLAAALLLSWFASACVVEDGDGGGRVDVVDEVTDLAPDADPAPLGEVRQDLAEATCGHSICDTGFALSRTCDSCVLNICERDPFCCSGSWDSICVSEVASVCGLGPAPVSGATTVSAIQVQVKTGGDDLRGGSQAFGSFQLAGGVTLPKASINNGTGFPGNSVRTGTVSLSGSRRLDSLRGFTLEWDGAPRNIFDSYDNWDANEIRFFIQPLGPGRCPNLLGAPFTPGRMTGSRTLASTTVSFP